MVALSDLPFNPAENSAGAQMAQDALYGDNQTGVGWAMLENVPNVTTIMGWNAHRASNTIIKASGKRTGSHPGIVRGSVRNTLSPFRFGSLKSYDDIGGTNGSYTPFNALAWGGNLAMRGAERVGMGGTLMEGDESFFAKGTYARLNTAGRLSRRGGTSNRDKRARRGAREFLEQTDSERWGRISAAYGDSEIDVRDLRHFVASGAKSTYSNIASGYIQGAMGGPSRAATPFLSESYMKGVNAASRHLAAGGNQGLFKGMRTAAASLGDDGARLGAKGAMKFGGAKAAALAGGSFIPGVNAALWAYTAVDITKMLLSATKQIPGFTRDALNSFKGGIQKPVFGTRFLDNSVAATSRQRGVMAIQASQLNARSVLGNEAAGLYSYFG